MKKLLLLQVAIILIVGLATGFAFTLNPKVVLHGPLNVDVPKPAPTGPTGVTGPIAVTGPTGATGITGVSGPTGKPPPPPIDKPATLELFISMDDAKKFYDGKQAIFIDARPKDEYIKSHIMGAMQLEKGDFDKGVPAKIDYLVGSTVIVYCHGELCTDSENVVKRLAASNKGIGPFHIIKAGFPGWEAAKYPMDAGREVGFD